jgi:hypothetical protein
MPSESLTYPFIITKMTKKAFEAYLFINSYMMKNTTKNACFKKKKKIISFIFWFCKTVPVNQALRACMHPFTMYKCTCIVGIGQASFPPASFPSPPLYRHETRGGGGGAWHWPRWLWSKVSWVGPRRLQSVLRVSSGRTWVTTRGVSQPSIT